eukprot:Skav236286  [mRNA]  locus=scaffold2529:50094:50501:+ [translate_table: standard]
MKTLQDGCRDLRSIAFGEQLVATAGEDREVRVYDLSQDLRGSGDQDVVLVKSLERVRGTVYSIAFCQDLLAAGGQDAKLRIYNAAEESDQGLQVRAIGPLVAAPGCDPV